MVKRYGKRRNSISEAHRSLEPRYDSRKSFYGKAHVVDDSDGSQILYSYDTPVCKINSSGEVELLAQWDSSQTTLRHVKEFLQQNGFKTGSKSQIASMYGKKVERVSRKSRKAKSFKESRMLTEGPGAGYTVETRGISDVNITKIQYSKEQSGGYIYSIEGTATLDSMRADSAYYGTGEIQGPIKISLNYVWLDSYDVDGVDDESELIEIATNTIYDHPDTSFVYGGGYSHSTYDGKVGELERNSDDYWTGYLYDSSIIRYIDDAVSGDNKYEYYRVVLDDYDVYDAYDTENEAVEIANELGDSGEYESVTVERVTEYIDYNGETIDDYTEQVYEYV